MDAILSAIWYPVHALFFTPADDDDDPGYDPIYPLTVFFALGIWFVFKRYQYIRYRAVPFSVPIPDAASLHWTSITLQNPSLEAHLADPSLLPGTIGSPSSHASQHVPLPGLQHQYSAGQKFITCYDPSTGYHLATIPADSEFDISEKINRARLAWTDSLWAQSSFGDRRRVIRSLKKWLVDNRETCARVACRDTGKTMVDAAFGEILTCCSKMDWLIDHGEYALRPERRRTTAMMFYKSSKVYYEPLGVVSAIVSWNYPLHNCLSPILASLFSGNAIVIKCSEHVIWSTSWFIRAIRHCLVICGHPADLVQLVCCYPSEAEALTTSPYIKHITFIGSETVGRKVLQAATTHMTPVTLELGGKDPAVILPETNLNKSMSIWMRGVFQNSGQNCIGIERFLVHSSQHDELVRLFTDRVQKLRVGPCLADAGGDGVVAPVDCGAMISRDRFEELERLLNDAAQEGAEVVLGGHGWRHPYVEEGMFFAPTVIARVAPTTELAQTETFAPIVCIMPYESVDEAIAIANGTRYGLGASVWGPRDHECIRVARSLECGMVSVNDFAVFYMKWVQVVFGEAFFANGLTTNSQDLPFGGVKGSGFGRFAGPEGLRSLTAPKAVTVDRWPSLLQGSIPSAVDYPIRSMVKSWDFVSGTVGLFYGGSLSERVESVWRMIRASL